MFNIVNNVGMDKDIVSKFWAPLHWLTVLSEHGSYTAAAARLGVSKASVSQRIAELEKSVGVPLVRRTTRSVQLTDAGLQLVHNTRDAFDQIAWSFSSIRDLAKEPMGLLRVTVPVAFARQQLLPRLPEFLQQFPDIRLELDLSDRISSLATDGFDLAIRHVASPPETHVAWELATTQPLLVASKTYLELNGTPNKPEDLAKHRCLYYPRPRERLTWTLQYSNGEGSTRPRSVTVPVHGAFAANNSEVLRDIAIAGLGIAVLPDFSAQAALKSGELIRILPEWNPVSAFSNRIYAIRPYSPNVPQAIQVFVSFLRGAFAGGFSST